MPRARPLTIAASLVCLMAVAGCGGGGESAARDLSAGLKDEGVNLSHDDSSTILRTTKNWHAFDTKKISEVMKDYAERGKEFLAEHSDEEQEAICAISAYRNDNGSWPTGAGQVTFALVRDKLTSPQTLARNFLPSLNDTVNHFSSGNDIDAQVQALTLYCEGASLLQAQ